MCSNSPNLTSTTQLSPLISVQTRTIVEVINFIFISQSIGLFGIVANIINIIVFAKQGLHEAANISLLSLAIADLGCLLTMEVMGICHNPLFYNSDVLSFDPREIVYLTAQAPHGYFTRATRWITAFVTFERCICITMPLKVKDIFTPRRAVVAMIVIYVSMMVNVSPVYYTTKFGWKWFPERNRSLIGLIFRDNKAEVDNILMSFNVFLPLASFVFVVICTIILIVKMRSKTKWRKVATSSSGNGSGNVSSRDMRVIKMVTFISVIFIMSAIPSTAVLLGFCIQPEFNSTGRYSNLFMTVFSFLYVFETINSSINIFIYMRMSTRYKATFNNLFGRDEKV